MNERAEQALQAMRRLTQDEQAEIITQLLSTPRRADADVEVGPLRERFLIRYARDGLTAHEVAASCGWYYGDKPKGEKRRGDSTRVLRRLGMVAQQTSKRGDIRYTVTRHIGYDIATTLALALDADFHEVGI